MKQSRATIYLAVIVSTLFSFSLLFCIITMYQQLNGDLSLAPRDLKSTALLSNLKEKLRHVKSKGEVALVLKTLEKLPESDEIFGPLKELRAIYGITSDYVQEADKFDYIVAKNKAITGLFNFYRRQVVQRKLATATVLSGLINDGNSLFIKEKRPSLVLAFVRRSKEKLKSLNKAAIRYSNPGETLRKSKEVHRLLTNLEDLARNQITWNREKETLHAKSEKLINEIVSKLSLRQESSLDILQRDFLLVIFFCILVFLCVGLIVYFGAKRINDTFSKRRLILSRYLFNFGMSERSQVSSGDIALLEKEEEWKLLLEAIRKAEDEFKKQWGAEIALSRSIKFPFVVFSQQKKAKYWNSCAVRVLNLESKDELDEISLADFLERSSIETGSGRDSKIIEDIRQKMDEGKEVYIQSHLKFKEELLPLEIGVFPIETGPYKGGNILLFWEMKDEERRIADRVISNIKVIDDLIDKISTNEEFDFSTVNISNLPEQVIPIVDKLRSFGIKLEEKDRLWKSEIEAILVQVKKEEEILNRLFIELRSIQKDHDIILHVSNNMKILEEKLVSNSTESERYLLDMNGNWRRICVDIESKRHAAEKGTKYEEEVRSLVEEMKSWNDKFSDNLKRIKKCKEWVKIHAINLNLGDPKDAEIFRDRARQFSLAMGEFYERIVEIENDFEGFIIRHPGSGKIPVLDNNVDLSSLISSISESYEKLKDNLAEWKSINTEIKSLSDKTKSFIEGIEIRKEEVSKLNKTCRAANRGAIDNLERWR